jgi:hypothetical protein
MGDPRVLSELLAAEQKADALLEAIETRSLVRPGRSETRLIGTSIPSPRQSSA